MSNALKNSAGANAARGFPRFRAISVLAVVGAALLAGCAKRDSITVGSVPDDYRTNHPIVIGEKEEVLDLPVAASDRGMTHQQRASLEGFLSGYDRSAAPVLRIMTPSGAANDVAASRAASDFARVARANGVPASRLMMLSYQSAAADVSAPVRLAYTAMKAQTDRCGRWPEDILKTEENKHYADFGCSYQNNLAAQIANPADLLGPRKETPIDAARRANVIDAYRNAPAWVPVPAQEVDY
ncbi:MAG: CpaD family pilus assembly protein [Mesorhizobium sp.]